MQQFFYSNHNHCLSIRSPQLSATPCQNSLRLWTVPYVRWAQHLHILKGHIEFWFYAPQNGKTACLIVVKGTYWILEWTFDQRESSIHQQVKLDYVDTGAHIAPHCGVTNAKLRASIPVIFINILLFCWICHHFSSCSIIRELQLTWAFPPSWQWQGKCTKALMGSGLSSRGWQIKYSRWQLLLCLHLFFSVVFFLFLYLDQ